MINILEYSIFIGLLIIFILHSVKEWKNMNKKFEETAIIHTKLLENINFIFSNNEPLIILNNIKSIENLILECQQIDLYTIENSLETLFNISSRLINKKIENGDFDHEDVQSSLEKLVEYINQFHGVISDEE